LLVWLGISTTCLVASAVFMLMPPDAAGLHGCAVHLVLPDGFFLMLVATPLPFQIWADWSRWIPLHPRD
jgi:hypothetical protein